MRHGENPLEVTRRIKARLRELSAGLPKAVRIIPFYDRTPLIEGAVATVSATVVEAMITAAICVWIVLVHFRTSLLVSLTLPLSVLSVFAIIRTLRVLGVIDVETNIMSLAGLAISIGVLVDSSIVAVENVSHRLKEHYGDRPARRPAAIVGPACKTVGKPMFFSILIMLVSFLPVFALSGMEGKLLRPLAFTKTFALISVAALSITLVPASARS